jgi:hypothetical protein
VYLSIYVIKSKSFETTEDSASVTAITLSHLFIWDKNNHHNLHMGIIHKCLLPRSWFRSIIFFGKRKKCIIVSLPDFRCWYIKCKSEQISRGRAPRRTSKSSIYKLSEYTTVWTHIWKQKL